MSAPETTQLQLNFKLDDQTLVNIYLREPLSLPTALGVLRDSAQEIAETRALLNGATKVVSTGITGVDVAVTPPAAPQQAAPPTWAAQAQAVDQFTQQQVSGPPQPAATPAAGAGPVCEHGQRVWKEGTGKQSGKPYKGWFCPANAQGCKPQFA